MRRVLAGMLSLLLFLDLGGCVERTLTVQTTPPGALVTMNDQEIGRAPVARPFLWYGYFDVQVRKEGYQTLQTTTPVIAPWWQWIPFDLVAEILPFKFEDPHTVSYTLAPQSHAQVDPGSIIDRGQALQELLESSRLPQTQPATRPAKKH
ncbi:MAG TPA: PEGA domain-containing protein [Tepidisphaeraceae bacterium]